MTQHQIVTVEFHGQSLIAVEVEGKPYVAMRPIVENIGLQWGSQFNRIQRNPVLAKGVFMMKTPSNGGEQETICLPLSMLNGWLFGVDVNRVREEIRPKLIRYQTECFDVLYRHFMPAQRPYNPAIDYTRISPAQAQDLKELVQSIVEAGIQSHGETWARLHRKFRVNSYLQLPATQHLEARQYLLGKLPCGYAATAQRNHLPPTPPGKVLVDLSHLASIYTDLGKLRRRVDALAMPAQDTPPSWWQQQTIGA